MPKGLYHGQVKRTDNKKYTPCLCHVYTNIGIVHVYNILDRQLSLHMLFLIMESKSCFHYDEYALRITLFKIG